MFLRNIYLDNWLINDEAAGNDNVKYYFLDNIILHFLINKDINFDETENYADKLQESN